MKAPKTLVSVIIPLLNEEENVGPLYERLQTQFLHLADEYDYEFIYVDDGSTDNSVEVIQALSSQRRARPNRPFIQELW